MSDLWRGEVKAKGENWVDIKVKLVHPDAGNFPEDPNFGLQLLTQKAYKLNDSFENIPVCPLGEKIPFDDSYLPDNLEGYVSDIVEKVLVYKTERVPYSDDKFREMLTKKLHEQGIDEDSDEWDFDTELDILWDEEWKESNLPYALYRIKVTDPKWIEHLKTGVTFSSAGFSETGPFIKENVDIDPDSIL